MIVATLVSSNEMQTIRSCEMNGKNILANETEFVKFTKLFCQSFLLQGS